MKQQTATTAASYKVKRISISQYETTYRARQEERLNQNSRAPVAKERESLRANEAAYKKRKRGEWKIQLP